MQAPKTSRNSPAKKFAEEEDIEMPLRNTQQRNTELSQTHSGNSCEHNIKEIKECPRAKTQAPSQRIERLAQPKNSNANLEKRWAMKELEKCTFKPKTNVKPFKKRSQSMHQPSVADQSRIESLAKTRTRNFDKYEKIR